MRCLNCHTEGILPQAQYCFKCGVHLPTLLRDVLPTGTRLKADTYEIDYAIGRGGFGITYRAHHTMLEQTVAIKEYYPQELAHRQINNGDLSVPQNKQDIYQRWLNRFIREGRILAKLNHPNLVRVQDLFEAGGTAYLVMEFLSGKTLRQELDDRPNKKLSPQQVTEIVTCLVDALALTHGAGVYHLDIKPDNILLTPEGRVILIDFGAAKQTNTTNQTHSTRAFTPNYAPMEIQVPGQVVGPESDIFELGMMLHEMLTGTLPEPALGRMIGKNWQANLSEPWQSIVTAALHLSQEERPKNIQQWWTIKPASNSAPTTPDHTDYYQQAVAHLDREEYHEAIIYLNKAIAINPNFAEAYSQRCFAHWKLEAYQLALVDGNKAIEVNPNLAEGYKNRGVAYDNLGESEKAIADYTKAIEINPQFASAYSNRGLAYGKLGEYKKAIEDWTKVIEINPHFADAYFGRGIAYKKLGESQKAIADYTKAIEINPQLPGAYRNRGVAYRKLGEYKKAIADYTKAIEINPQFANAYFGRGIASDNLGESQKAITDFTKAIEINPQYADAYYNRGVVYGKLGESEKAIADWTKAIEINPQDADAYNNRGIAYGNLGEDEKEIADYTKAIEINPQYASAYKNRGIVYRKLGENEKAEADFQKADELRKK
ncbi:tetratricopeptide repeat protein [Planktothricoides raciborskii]|uniref:Tetratricopeptide repeat protein n=1 Tax=Planktothricoides raciborskii GIHE-MW2 TaxID=2792601 RepID=A0AAU8J7Z9_9CYAN